LAQSEKINFKRNNSLPNSFGVFSQDIRFHGPTILICDKANFIEAITSIAQSAQQKLLLSTKIRFEHIRSQVSNDFTMHYCKLGSLAVA